MSNRATPAVPQAALRAGLALRLADLYGTEVPAYNTLVEVAREVNAEVAASVGADAERLGSLDRVTAERHGAIRVGSPEELAQAATVFAAVGMQPVGFYDLRDASASSVPVVSTAFRPVAEDELAANPFRMFTSMLVTGDRRFFDAQTQAGLERMIGERTLFAAELLALSEVSARDGGLPQADAERFWQLAAESLELSQTPIDHDWYQQLAAISAVAADIGGVPSTHLNHLTPRVLDIDELYRRMTERGIEMIDEIQGPPCWDGPDVLLRQTSFRALDERRTFRHGDGSVRPGTLRVRFGEVEQRGIALTATGRDVFDQLIAELDSRLAHDPTQSKPSVAQEVWAESLPATEAGLAVHGLGFFRYRPVPEVAGSLPANGTATTGDLVADGMLVREPIVYEDFLPRSAAGIFQSNLTDEGTRDDDLTAVHYDLPTLAEAIGATIADPIELYRAQQDASLTQAARALGLREITDPNRG